MEFIEALFIFLLVGLYYSSPIILDKLSLKIESSRISERLKKLMNILISLLLLIFFVAIIYEVLYSFSSIINFFTS